MSKWLYHCCGCWAEWRCHRDVCPQDWPVRWDGQLRQYWPSRMAHLIATCDVVPYWDHSAVTGCTAGCPRGSSLSAHTPCESLSDDIGRLIMHSRVISLRRFLPGGWRYHQENVVEGHRQQVWSIGASPQCGSLYTAVFARRYNLQFERKYQNRTATQRMSCRLLQRAIAILWAGQNQNGTTLNGRLSISLW